MFLVVMTTVEKHLNNLQEITSKTHTSFGFICCWRELVEGNPARFVCSSKLQIDENARKLKRFMPFLLILKIQHIKF